MCKESDEKVNPLMMVPGDPEEASSQGHMCRWGRGDVELVEQALTCPSHPTVGSPTISHTYL